MNDKTQKNMLKALEHCSRVHSLLVDPEMSKRFQIMYSSEELSQMEFSTFLTQCIALRRIGRLHKANDIAMKAFNLYQSTLKRSSLHQKLFKLSVQTPTYVLEVAYLFLLRAQIVHSGSHQISSLRQAAATASNLYTQAEQYFATHSITIPPSFKNSILLGQARCALCVGDDSKTLECLNKMELRADVTTNTSCAKNILLYTLTFSKAVVRILEIRGKYSGSADARAEVSSVVQGVSEGLRVLEREWSRSTYLQRPSLSLLLAVGAYIVQKNKLLNSNCIYLLRILGLVSNDPESKSANNWKVNLDWDYSQWDTYLHEYVKNETKKVRFQSEDVSVSSKPQEEEEEEDEMIIHPVLSIVTKSILPEIVHNAALSEFNLARETHKHSISKAIDLARLSLLLRKREASSKGETSSDKETEEEERESTEDVELFDPISWSVKASVLVSDDLDSSIASLATNILTAFPLTPSSLPTHLIYAYMLAFASHQSDVVSKNRSLGENEGTIVHYVANSLPFSVRSAFTKTQLTPTSPLSLLSLALLIRIVERFPSSSQAILLTHHIASYLRDSQQMHNMRKLMVSQSTLDVSFAYTQFFDIISKGRIREGMDIITRTTEGASIDSHVMSRLKKDNPPRQSTSRGFPADVDSEILSLYFGSNLVIAAECMRLFNQLRLASLSCKQMSDDLFNDFKPHPEDSKEIRLNKKSCSDIHPLHDDREFRLVVSSKLKSLYGICSDKALFTMCSACHSPYLSHSQPMAVISLDYQCIRIHQEARSADIYSNFILSSRRGRWARFHRAISYSVSHRFEEAEKDLFEIISSGYRECILHGLSGRDAQPPFDVLMVLAFTFHDAKKYRECLMVCLWMWKLYPGVPGIMSNTLVALHEMARRMTKEGESLNKLISLKSGSRKLSDEQESKVSQFLNRLQIPFIEKVEESIRNDASIIADTLLQVADCKFWSSARYEQVLGAHLPTIKLKEETKHNSELTADQKAEKLKDIPAEKPSEDIRIDVAQCEYLQNIFEKEVNLFLDKAIAEKFGTSSVSVEHQAEETKPLDEPMDDEEMDVDFGFEEEEDQHQQDAKEEEEEVENKGEEKEEEKDRAHEIKFQRSNLLQSLLVSSEVFGVFNKFSSQSKNAEHSQFRFLPLEDTCSIYGTCKLSNAIMLDRFMLMRPDKIQTLRNKCVPISLKRLKDTVSSSSIKSRGVGAGEIGLHFEELLAQKKEEERRMAEEKERMIEEKQIQLMDEKESFKNVGTKTQQAARMKKKSRKEEEEEMREEDEIHDEDSGESVDFDQIEDE
eukprot:gnl/Carplike_NY0171/2053_a2767_340.p1 GENE.gnl/Carplike_NY0171/2053_a2767_340~~gnl/Carplike_NY0171/2053_a2767_340.p1  ORF type:complete len:1396 (-),score=369.23 gnl/Carplike_NY0171/2053_a2767_340:82-3948(-)